MNTKRVLKFFNELDPKAQERLAEIAKKIAENKKLTAYDKLLIEQARSKYNAKKPILDAELAGKKALAERLRVAEEKRLATPALPVKASESNLGTPRNPIVAKGAIGTPAEMTGRRRNTQGYNDAPVKGDMTKL